VELGATNHTKVEFRSIFHFRHIFELKILRSAMCGTCNGLLGRANRMKCEHCRWEEFLGIHTNLHEVMEIWILWCLEQIMLPFTRAMTDHLQRSIQMDVSVFISEHISDVLTRRELFGRSTVRICVS
jgi:hypothetical protein